MASECEINMINIHIRLKTFSFCFDFCRVYTTPLLRRARCSALEFGFYFLISLWLEGCRLSDILLGYLFSLAVLKRFSLPVLSIFQSLSAKEGTL
jgi:hypothetical protein